MPEWCPSLLVQAWRTRPTPVTVLTPALPPSALRNTTNKQPPRLEGRRWTGEEAAAAGLVDRVVPIKQLTAAALAEAGKQAKLTASGVYGYTKHATKGHVPREILE